MLDRGKLIILFYRVRCYDLNIDITHYSNSFLCSSILNMYYGELKDTGIKILTDKEVSLLEKNA